MDPSASPSSTGSRAGASTGGPDARASVGKDDRARIGESPSSTSPPPGPPTDPVDQPGAAAKPPRGLWQRRWIRWPVIALGIYLVVCGLLALAVPFGLERYGLSKAAELTGRSISAEKIRFNPFTLRLVAQGLRVGGPAAGSPTEDTAPGDALRLAEFDLDLSILGVRYLAPVIEGLRLVGPDVRIVRLADGRFDFQDILDRLEALPRSDPAPEDTGKGPARFAFHNLEIVDGQIHFDDRQLTEQHDITALQVGVPFVSTLPADIETLVKPVLAAVIDGSPLSLGGDTLPFHETRRSHLAVKLDDLVIGKYLKLSPVPFGFTSPEGTMSLDLEVGFHQDAEGNHLTIDGPVRIDGLALDATGGDRLVAVKRLEARLAGVEPLISRFPVDSVSVDGLDVQVVRAADGSLPIAQAFTPKPTEPKPTESKSSSSGGSAVDWSVASTTVRHSRITVTDRTTTPPVKLDQHDITVDLGAIGNRQRAPAPITVSLGHNASGRLDWKGELDLAKSRAGGQLGVALPGVADYLPYLVGQLAASLGTGALTFDSTFESQWGGDVALTLNDGKAAVETVQLALPDDKAKDAAVRVGRVAIEGLGLSLADRHVKIARSLVAKADLRVLRDARGQLNLSRIVADGEVATRAAPGTRNAKPAAAASRPAPGSERPSRPWAVEIARVDLEDNQVQWQDRATPSPVNLPISRLSGSIANVGTKLDQAVNTDLRMTVGRNGQLTVKGSAVPDPLSLDMNLQWRNLALGVIDPYLAETIGIELRRGDATGNGRLRYGRDRARFAGRLTVSGLEAPERRSGDELLRWKVLNVTGIDADVLTASGKGPRRGPADRISIGEVDLTGFFARVELSADGRLNISDLLQSADAPDDKGAKDGKDGKDGKGGGAAKSPASQPATVDGPPMQIRIGGIALKDGAANFTDHFIKPNYSADLSGLSGTVSAMASEGTEPADVDINGSVNGDAPITIGGKLNPLGPALYTDITASAKGIDLPTFSPYSGKYAGYIIEKGKLSLNVHYRIENEKLQATNRVFLDQLTFGEKVDSPDATSLPVQFAIGLLKNNKGEIDLSLPISGSLDDPEFSFGGIIWNAFVNLITKIVTSPFTALASAFGGGEELSFVDFEPGTAVLTADSLKRLETISKALTDRPALKLDITGWMDPKAEARAFGKARLEQRLQALRGGREDDDESEPVDAKPSGKPKEGAAAGAAAGQSAAKSLPPLAPAQREALVKRLAQSLKVPLAEPPPAKGAAGPAAATTARGQDGQDGQDGKRGADGEPTTARDADAATTRDGTTASANEGGTTATKGGTTASAHEGAASPQAGLEARVAAALAGDPEAQRKLAIRRAQLPRNWLASEGKIDPERIFLLAPKVVVATGGGTDAAASSGPAEPGCTRHCAAFSLR